ncbi:MAG: metallophosphoesterase, partial [Verrucomicrobia bacterium]|nr:metallophosphoesterase [Verrucomicrobiota bacterium]
MQLSSIKCTERFIERLWDVWCIASVIGLWPRFIEPASIFTSHLSIPIPTLPKELNGLRIVQFSDLHYSQYTSEKFLKRASKKIASLSPDLIVFTGDLISYSELSHVEPLQSFLTSLEAPLGCFAIFGNHDYSEYVSLASDGTIRKVSQHLPAIMKGFARLFSFKDKTDQSPQVVGPVDELKPLHALFERSGFTVLHNKTVQIGKESHLINLTGLGDIMAGQCLPNKAFENYNISYPGIVL